MWDPDLILTAGEQSWQEGLDKHHGGRVRMGWAAGRDTQLQRAAGVGPDAIPGLALGLPGHARSQTKLVLASCLGHLILERTSLDFGSSN